MMKRTLTGAIIAVLVYAFLFFSHIPAVLYTATALLCILAIFEIYRVTGIQSKTILILSWLALAGIVCIPILHYESILLIAFVPIVVLFGLLMIFMERVKFDKLWKSILIAFVTVLLFQAIPCLRQLENGFYYLTFAITACFVTDVAALLFGKTFGKHKLCPKLSPNKTVEGAIGGVVCTVLIGQIASMLLESYAGISFYTGFFLLWLFFVSAFGQFGDLCMSVIKRICGVKDFSNLFPGHGGVLDRFDSHLFAVLFTLVFCMGTGGFIV